MRRLVIILFTLATLLSLQASGGTEKSQWNKTRAIKDLPFPAFILREFRPEVGPGLEVHILMDPEDVMENNLRLLFEKVPEKYPNEERLEVMVSTDIEQLKPLVTEFNMSGSPPEEKTDVSEDTSSKTQKRKERNHKWAYYKRTRGVELFRYNPSYPDNGMKTIILKGEE